MYFIFIIIDITTLNFSYCLEQSLYVLDRLDLSAFPIIYIVSDNTYYNFDSHLYYHNFLKKIYDSDVTLCYYTIKVDNFVLNCDDNIKDLCDKTNGYIITSSELPVEIYVKCAAIKKYVVNSRCQLYEITTYSVTRNRLLFIQQRIREGFKIISYIDKNLLMLVQLKYEYGKNITIFYTLSGNDQLKTNISIEMSVMPEQYNVIPYVYKNMLESIKTFDTKIINYNEYIRTSPYQFTDTMIPFSYVYIIYF